MWKDRTWWTWRPEPWWLGVLLVVAVGGWGVIELAEWAAEGDAHAVDRALLLALRNPADPSDPLGPRWLEEAMRDFTALGSMGVLGLVVAAAAGFLALARRRRTAGFVLAACLSGALLSTGLKLTFARPRPDLVPHGAEVFTASFPSGHALLSALVYLTLAALVARTLQRRRLRLFVLALAAALTVLVGVSRIYLGVHWPSDVLAGWAAGAAWALAWWAAAQALRPRRDGDQGDRNGAAALPPRA